MRTAKDITSDLLRGRGLTTVAGNPGSTGEAFLEISPATSAA